MGKVKKKKFKEICRGCTFKGICRGLLLDEKEKCLSLASEFPSPCPICDGVKRVLRGGAWESCVCVVYKKASVYLSKLGKDVNFSLSSEMIQSLRGLDPRKGLYIEFSDSSRDQMYSILAFFLLKMGLSAVYEVLNFYDLVKIFVGNDEKYSSPLDIIPDFLILTHGFSEPRNKLYAEIVLSVLINRERKALPTWIYSIESLEEKFPTIFSYLVQSGWQTLEARGRGEIQVEEKKPYKKRVDSRIEAIKSNLGSKTGEGKPL